MPFIFRVKPYSLFIVFDKYANREIIIKPDKKAIKQALKDGILIKGVELKQNQNIQIK